MFMCVDVGKELLGLDNVGRKTLINNSSSCEFRIVVISDLNTTDSLMTDVMDSAVKIIPKVLATVAVGIAACCSSWDMETNSSRNVTAKAVDALSSFLSPS